MDVSCILQVLYTVWIGIMLNMDVVKPSIFQYEEEDTYLQTIDRTEVNERNHDRYRRSLSEHEGIAWKDTQHTNISTHFIFKKDSNNVAFVFWKHANTTVIFILTCQNANTTNYNKHSKKGCKSKSKFYRSDDHGKSFVSITQGIEGAHLHSIYLSPTNKQFITLTDYKNKTIYLTNDEGRTFGKYKVPFKPTYIHFHPVREDYIAAYDNSLEGENSLFVSENRGKNWVRVAKKVRNYFWARAKYDDDDRIIFVEKESGKKVDSKTVSSHLYMAAPPYTMNQSRLIYNKHLVPFSVHVGEKFILAEGLHDRKLYVLAGKKKTFVMATFNKVTKPHVMCVVISDENGEILLALIHPVMQASLYLSDSSGENFRLQQTDILTEAIKNHVVPPKMDLYVVKGVQGTYIVNKRGMGSSITFDKGHTWRVIQVANKHAKGGQLSTRCGTQCDLALYLKIENPFSDFTAPIISKTNAPGIIIAQGHIGRYRLLERAKHYVFMSTDGGYTWKQKLGTSNGYVILDHGGLIAATPLKSTSLPTAQITYSLDYGANWVPIHLTEMYSRIAAIITESTASLLVMNVFGFLSHDKSGSYTGNTWIVWHFNFSKVLNAPCTDKDYFRWQQNQNACVMGEQISSKRRNSTKRCYSGPNFNNSLSRLPCSCTYKDFFCSKIFYRRKDDTCAPINPKHKSIKVCKAGDYYKRTKGYIKRYGSKCKGGVEDSVAPTIEKCEITTPVTLKIKASSRMVAVDQLVTFYIVLVDGVINATYVWTFSDQNKQIRGSYGQMKKVNYKFQKSGLFNVTLMGLNKKGKAVTSIVVKVVENWDIHPRIFYTHPVLVNKLNHFSLQTFSSDGTLVQIPRPPQTKFLWSFDGVFVGYENSIALDYTFENPGTVNVEVQIITSVSSEVLQESVTVYDSAVVVELFFSKNLDRFNVGTKTWIIDFETKFKNYLDSKYEFITRGVSDRVVVRGSFGTPTRLSIIICDTKRTINNQTIKASAIANMIGEDINENKPLVKGYEPKGVRVVRARVIVSSAVRDNNAGEKYTWVYILIVIIIMAGITSLMAYYLYRRKRTLLCFYPHDSMNKQLVDDESDNEVEAADAHEVYNNL